MDYTDDLGKLKIIKNGVETECDILFTFTCEELGKNYIGYTDGTISKNGRKNIYVNSYDPILGFKQLEDVKTKAEMDMIQDVLKQIDQDEGGI